MEQDIFTAEEWTNIKMIMNSIHHNIPEAVMGTVWNAYQRIEKTNTKQPCACSSAAKYWISAVEVIRNYIVEKDPLNAK
jgi:hypothetical protein